MPKKNKTRLPNAPELQEVLLDSSLGQQPSHNPYYPDLSQAAPPPYSDLSTEPARMGANSYTRNQLYSGGTPLQPLPRQTTVVVQQPAVSAARDVLYSHRSNKVRKFNNELITYGVLVILGSFWATSLYKDRQCVMDFVIHQPSHDVTVRLSDLKGMHTTIAYLSMFVVAICGLKCMLGFSKDNSCYLFIIGMCSLFGALLSGYMVYLSFYSPCVPSLNELISKASKSILAKLASSVNEHVSNPEKGFFGETNIFQYADVDKQGMIIFLINLFNFIVYFSKLLAAMMSC